MPSVFLSFDLSVCLSGLSVSLSRYLFLGIYLRQISFYLSNLTLQNRSYITIHTPLSTIKHSVVRDRD